MRFVIAATVLAIAATSASASEQIDCEVYDKIAKAAMEIRQKGIAMADAIKPMSKKKSDPQEEAVRVAMLTVFKEAYRSPRFDTPKYQMDAVSDFRSKIYSTCLDI
ncbi:hypothetical protein SAMN04490207_6179 [Pseudomonas gessardii]|jgi:hypothetical protein|uniref:hypothetical protein n=1 Tax=Pseudomonas gessardii TaxID=78544 RepID=UPI000886542D|nr:hypothetical protein [Pseudomonas gessardii]MRU54295.1 hypothetical protein [Pseudomonas gessardii]ONH35956.1 hypothetical protein BLL38_28135 [Pseudomonas gessardii]SDR41107.1 hypothetical protein SAMN04490207_6179 [Pseudomonas gessardii]